MVDVTGGCQQAWEQSAVLDRSCRYREGRPGDILEIVGLVDSVVHKTIADDCRKTKTQDGHARATPSSSEGSQPRSKANENTNTSHALPHYLHDD